MLIFFCHAIIKLFPLRGKWCYIYENVCVCICGCIAMCVCIYIFVCLPFFLKLKTSKQVLAVVWLWLSFLPEAAQIAGKKACERMKDVIRRGVDRQVAEGMFERAQERMQHQFQQLKVCYIHSLNSSRAPWGSQRSRYRRREKYLFGSMWSWCLLQRGSDPCPRHQERRPASTGHYPFTAPACWCRGLCGAVTSEMQPPPRSLSHLSSLPGLQ